MRLRDLTREKRICCSSKEEVKIMKNELERLGYTWMAGQPVVNSLEESFLDKYYFILHPEMKKLCFSSQVITTSLTSFSAFSKFEECTVGLIPKIDNVFYNSEKRTTVVLWKDGTITKVTCGKEDKYDREVGLAMCFAKKCLGNTRHYHKVFKKFNATTEN